MSKYPAGSQVAEGYYVFDQGYNPKPYEFTVLGSQQLPSSYSSRNIPPGTVCRIKNLDPTINPRILYEFELAGISCFLQTRGMATSMPLEEINFQMLPSDTKAFFIKRIDSLVSGYVSSVTSSESSAQNELVSVNVELANSHEAAQSAFEAIKEINEAGPSILGINAAVSKAERAVKDIDAAIGKINYSLNEIPFHEAEAAKAINHLTWTMLDPAASESLTAAAQLSGVINSPPAIAAIGREINDRHTDAIDYKASAVAALEQVRSIASAAKERIAANAATAAATAASTAIANNYRRTAGIETNRIAAAVRAGLAGPRPPVENWSSSTLRPKKFLFFSGGKYKTRKTRRNNRNKSRKQRKNNKRN